MSVLDETWTNYRASSVNLEPTGEQIGYFSDNGPAEEWEADAMRARLAAAAPAMARMLLDLSRHAYDGHYCSMCGEAQYDLEPGENHLPDCPLVALLRKAGVL